MLFKIHPPELRPDEDLFDKNWRGLLLHREPTDFGMSSLFQSNIITRRMFSRNPWRKWFAWYPVRVALIPRLTPRDYYPAWRWVWLETVEYSYCEHWIDSAMSKLAAHYKCHIYPRYRFIAKEE